MPFVRAATPEDARRIAAVHVESWRAAYRGIIPGRALDEISIDSRLPWWDHVLAGGVDDFHVFVVEDDDGQVQGFGSACRSGTDPDAIGEVAQLYLRPAAWGSGLAVPLMLALEDDLRGRGLRSAELLVVPTNDRACRFYERQGWQDTEVAHHEVVWGVEFATTTYRRDL